MTPRFPLLLLSMCLPLGLWAAGCKRDADERLGLDEKRVAEQLDVAKLTRDGELEKALSTPAAEVATRIGSWRLAQAATLTIGAGDKKDTLEQTWKLEVDGKGGVHATVDNSHDHGFETVVAGGVVYVRPRHGRYARHAPEGDEIERIRDGVQGVVAGYLSVLGRFAERTDEGDTTVGERKARRIKLTLAGSPRRLRDSDPAHAWRKTMKVAALEGTVDVDAQSGLPLHVVLEASWTAERPPQAASPLSPTPASAEPAAGGAGEVTIKLSLRADADQFGAVPPITAPEGPLSSAIRTRPLVDRATLLDGLVPAGGPGEAPPDHQLPRSPDPFAGVRRPSQEGPVTRGPSASGPSPRRPPDLGFILERAALAQIAALVPVPFVEDLLSDAARRALLQRIADHRGVGVGESALPILSRVAVFEDLGAPAAAANRMGRHLLWRSFRRLGTIVRVVGHAGDFTTTVAVATLFDHYCARHHVGAGLDVGRATLLRALIDAATVEARGELVRRGARGAVRATGQVLLAAPRAAFGARALRGRGGGARSPDDAVDRVEPGEAPRGLGGTMVQRSIRAVSGLAGGAGRAWIDALMAAFDRRWLERGGLVAPASQGPNAPHGRG